MPAKANSGRGLDPDALAKAVIKAADGDVIPFKRD
jgi:hypothetical protein